MLSKAIYTWYVRLWTVDSVQASNARGVVTTTSTIAKSGKLKWCEIPQSTRIPQHSIPTITEFTLRRVQGDKVFVERRYTRRESCVAESRQMVTVRAGVASLADTLKVKAAPAASLLRNPSLVSKLPDSRARPSEVTPDSVHRSARPWLGSRALTNDATTYKWPGFRW
jgi:hypothetical protein